MMPQRRNRRSGVEDRWTKADGTNSATYGHGKRWRARYVDDQAREIAKGFDTKREARQWLDSQVSTVVTGTHVAPRDAQTTMAQWCDTWLEGYAVNRDSTVRTARKNVAHIIAEFGDMPLSTIRPTQVKTWVAKLKDQGHKPSHVYQLHKRLSQVCNDAVHDGLLGRNPCSRRTSPPAGKQKVFCPTTEQVWELHDAMPEHLRVAILLGAFAGLRISEVSGLRIADVDFLKGIVHPVQQWGGAPLKTKGCDAAIPIPRELTLLLSASVQEFGTEWMVTDGKGGPCPPWHLSDTLGAKRNKMEELPDEFSFHDLRHYLASLLIASGADIKTVQARLRHATASTTLDTYGHLWPDADESTRTAVANIIKVRMAADAAADGLRTDGPL
jgi:integrase